MVASLGLRESKEYVELDGPSCEWKMTNTVKSVEYGNFDEIQIGHQWSCSHCKYTANDQESLKEHLFSNHLPIYNVM